MARALPFAVLVLLAGALAPATYAAGDAVPPPPVTLGSNLILNPGAEDSPGVTDRTSVACPKDWSCRTSESTVAQYGTSVFPSMEESQRIGGGNNFLAGGPQTGGLLGEFPDVRAAASDIDAGLLQVTLSACLGGLAGSGDFANLSASFSAPNKPNLGQTQTLSTPDRGGQTKFLPVTTTRPVPAETRDIFVALNMTDVEGNYTDAYADNVALTLTSAGSTPPAPSCAAGSGSNAGGGGGGGSGGGSTSRVLAFGTARLGRGGVVRVPVRCATTAVARCTGSLAAALVKGAGATRAGVAKYAIPAGARRT